MPLKNWDPVWRWIALFELLVVLLIARGIVQDWLSPPKHWDWVDTFWGANTEAAEHLRLCGEDGSRCLREQHSPLAPHSPD